MGFLHLAQRQVHVVVLVRRYGLGKNRCYGVAVWFDARRKPKRHGSAVAGFPYCLRIERRTPEGIQEKRERCQVLIRLGIEPALDWIGGKSHDQGGEYSSAFIGAGLADGRLAHGPNVVRNPPLAGRRA